MSSDLGKMYRRNYMVKSQLRSLTEKSKALNARIDGDTKIDEWAESYITRADAQIDDVSDYMNYRNLGNLSKGQGHIINYTVYEHAPTATPPGVPVPPPAPIAPPAPAPVPGGPDVSTTSLRFVETMPIELQVPFRRIDRKHDFANNDNRIGTYDNTKLMKEIFRTPTNSGPHELGDGRVKWPRLSQKYAEDNRVSHQRLIDLMETWKNTPASVVIQNAPTKRQIDAAIIQSRKSAELRTDQEEIMAIAADPNYGLFAGVGNLTDNFPLVTVGSTAGGLLMLGAMGAVYGLVTYSEYKTQKNLKTGTIERLKRMGIYGGVGAGIAALYKGVVGAGQTTGYY